MGGEFAESGLVSDERDRVMFGCPAQLVHHLSRRVAWRERIECFDGCLVAQAMGKKCRRLFGANEWAGKDLVDVDVEPREPLDRFLETIDSCYGERALRVVRPLVAAFRGDRVANEIEG